MRILSHTVFACVTLVQSAPGSTESVRGSTQSVRGSTQSVRGSTQLVPGSTQSVFGSTCSCFVVWLVAPEQWAALVGAGNLADVESVFSMVSCDLYASMSGRPKIIILARVFRI